MKEKISIIVPVYNSEKTLKRCVDSLICQTYSNIEIILVDDGSTDNSSAICKEYEKIDSRIMNITKNNEGVSTARNVGLDRASGEFIMFCDSDDWVVADWCEKMKKQYVSNNLVMSGYYCINSEGECTDKVSCGENTMINKTLFLETMDLGGFCPWNKLYESNLIKENKIRFPKNITLGEDKLFNWRYLKAITGDIICIGDCLNYYHKPQKNEKSLTVNIPFEYYEQCEFIYKEINSDILAGTKITKSALKTFYTDSYFQYENAIKRIFQSEMNIIKKIRIVNNVMKSEAYKVVSQNNCFVQNDLIKFFSRRNNCYGIYIAWLLKKY